MRIGIAGSSGFVGRAVVRRAARAGHEIVPISVPRLVTKGRDVASLLSEVEALLESFVPEGIDQVDAVVNAAGLAAPGDPMSDDLVGANALMPALLARSCAVRGVGRFIHVSSAAVYGDSCLDEKHPPNPCSPYGFSKRLGEIAVNRVEGMETVIYRPTSVHGFERRMTQSLMKFATSPLRSVAGTGQFPTPQTLVDNVAEVCLFLAESAELPKEPVLHPYEGLTTSSVLEHLSGKMPHQIPIPIARVALLAALAVGSLHPRIAANARRLEMLWFGQKQVPGWLDARSLELRGKDYWMRLGTAMRAQGKASGLDQSHEARS